MSCMNFQFRWIAAYEDSLLERKPASSLSQIHRLDVLKETPRRRIKVTSSVNEIFTDQLGNRAGDVERLDYLESNAKCRYLKKFTCKRTLRQVFFCLTPYSSLYTLYTCIQFTYSHREGRKGGGGRANQREG